MSVVAAVMTGKGTGAIATVQLFGDSAEAVITKIFKPTGSKSATFEPDKILLGKISDGTETIDQVTIGCEGPGNFAINCHGNPLIVAEIMQLLHLHGAELITAEQLLAKTLTAEKPTNTIALEAKLTQAKAETIEGTKIILNQIDAGLNRKAKEWLQNIDTTPLDEITADAERILKNSQTARLIIKGLTAVIVGPPNTGKSTLLNCLAGKQKAIVTDIKGTTRDWVSARCRIGSLSAELIDTAGLDEKPLAAPADTIKKAAQQRSVQLLERADLVLLVLDNNQTAQQLDDRLLKKIAGKKVITVLNKSDLPARLIPDKLPEILRDTMSISAKLSTGIENLLKKIQEIVAVVEFDLKQAVCFTSRQENLLKQLKQVKSKKQTASIITELLNGQLGV